MLDCAVETIAINDIDLDDPKYCLRLEFPEKHLRCLADSIQDKGQLHPIILLPPKLKKGKYTLVSGFCRTLAIKNLLQRQTIEAKVLPKHDEKAAYKIALMENACREDFSKEEIALAVHSMHVEGAFKTEVEIAKIVGKSPNTISEYIRALSCEGVAAALRRKRINLTVAILLSSPKMATIRQRIMPKVLEGSMSSREVKELLGKELLKDRGFGTKRHIEEKHLPDEVQYTNKTIILRLKDIHSWDDLKSKWQDVTAQLKKKWANAPGRPKKFEENSDLN